MKAALFTFSGTGHTKIVAGMLCRAFEEQGVEAEDFSIEDFTKGKALPDLAAYSLIGIGYPVYAFNTPVNVHRFVKSLPSLKGAKVFIFKSAGEPFYWNDSSSALIVKHFAKKGYEVVFERHFLMPYNIMFRYPDALVKQMYTTSQALARDMAERILKGEKKLIKFTLKSRAASFFFRIQWPGAALNGRLHSTGKKCSLCRKCVKECPTDNIRVKNGKIKFGWKCVMCMRCVMYCPRQAVRIGLLQHWALRGPYEFDRILKDGKIPSVYVDHGTKGYFRLFNKYFDRARTILDEKK